MKAIADTNWSYTTATWRSANALTTLGTYRVEYIMGLSLEPVYNEIHLTGAVYNSSNVNVALGIGVNATNANSADLFGGFAIDLAAYRNTISAIYRGLPSVGYTYLQWVEISDAVGTSDWYGPYCVGGNCRSGGMLGEIWN